MMYVTFITSLITLYLIQDIYLKDRVSFACLFLPDVELENFLVEVCNEVYRNVMLEGLLVTGLNTRVGIKLLQKYIDKVGTHSALFLHIVLLCVITNTHF